MRAGWPGSLGELAGRLKTWRATLQSTVEDSMPPYLRLEDEARNLQVRPGGVPGTGACFGTARSTGSACTRLPCRQGCAMLLGSYPSMPIVS